MVNKLQSVNPYALNNQHKLSLFLPQSQERGKFGGIVEKYLKGAIEQINATEKAGKDVAAGKADIHDWAIAYTNMEVNLKAFISIIESLQRSLQEILRLNI